MGVWFPTEWKKKLKCSKPPTSDWDALGCIEIGIDLCNFWVGDDTDSSNKQKIDAQQYSTNKNKDFSRDFYGSTHNKQNKIHHQGFFVGLRQNLGFDDFDQETLWFWAPEEFRK